MPKCADCGFLGLYNGTTNALDSAYSNFRNAGHRPNSGEHHFPPICIMASNHFPDFLDGSPQAACERLHNDNGCLQQITWIPGLSPSEHYEMFQANQLLQTQQAFQAEQARISEQRHSEAMQIALRGAWISAGSAIVAAVITAAIGLWTAFGQSAPVVNIVVPSQTAK